MRSFALLSNYIQTQTWINLQLGVIGPQPWKESQEIYDEVYHQKFSVQFNIKMLITEKNNDVIQQVKKLVNRINNLSQTKLNFFEYLIKSQQLVTDYSKDIKGQIEKFEGIIIQKSFYSIKKCQSIKRFISIYKQLCGLVQNFAKLNLVQIKKIDIQTSKQEEKLKSKSENFVKVVEEYRGNQMGYNKMYGQYQYHCDKLDDMISKFKSFEDPINFYNLNRTADFSKSLDKRYFESENKQASLISSLQLLDQKRKLLSDNLKDIKDDYVILLHTHMTNILTAAGCLADISKDQMYQTQSIIKVQREESDVFNQQIQRFDTKYGRNNGREEELFSDLKDLFKNSSQEVQITSDERLFLDRCETFMQKKSESVEEFLGLQKKLVEQLNNQISYCQKLDKQASSVEKSIFKSNGTEDFRKKVCKYFGQGTSSIAQMCFIIIDVPRRRFEKIGKTLQSHDDKLKRILQKKQEEFKKFKKRVSQVLAEHNNASKGYKNNLVSISQFKGNIEKTFSLFKNIYEQFVRSEESFDTDFDDVLKSIISFINRQSQHSLMKYTLGKQKEKFLYNTFKKFNSDSEIIDIVKQDSRYEVLFNDSLKPCLFNQFKSQIKKKKFEQTKKVLQKKQHQSRGIVGERQGGCCSFGKNRIQKYTKIKSHNASLFYQGQNFKSGKLQILNKGLMFEEKKTNPFGEKIQIIIPTKQIISFSHKTFQEGQNGIELLTNMGAISFLSEQYQEIEQSLQKNLGTKLALRDQNQSRLEKSSDSSSYLKQNNVSTEYKVSFDKSLASSQLRNNISKLSKPTNNDGVIFKKLIENWKKGRLFSQYFVLQTSQESASTGSIRSDYKFQNDLNKFMLKEKRSIKTFTPAENLLILNYQWKVSFPEMPMLKSFAHGQEVKIQLAQEIVKISITELNRGESHLFIRKTFYNEITPMNEKLVNLIVENCEREAHVIKNEQPESEESTIMLDMDNLAIDKEQITSKQQKLQKKYSTGNFGVDSEKGELRDSRILDIK